MRTAKVTVSLHATLRTASCSEGCVVDASDLIELRAALTDRYGLGFGEMLGSPGSPFGKTVVLVNGLVVPSESTGDVVLRDGDEVSIFPPISGG
ncbi:MAG: MoaD/ThiS family protein [Methanobacteriota archaeon]|nr:MAG: MoaD/ThiS family protein [Euryarchaeota archaeon]